MYSRYSLCLMRALRPHGWAKYIATKKVSSVLYTVEEGTEVPILSESYRASNMGVFVRFRKSCLV